MGCLWDAYGESLGTFGMLWLRCSTYGIDLWTYGNLWAAVAAVPTLWGIYGVLWLRCRPYGAPMGPLLYSNNCQHATKHRGKFGSRPARGDLSCKTWLISASGDSKHRKNEGVISKVKFQNKLK